MAKSPDAFRTISEVSTWLGTQSHVLRFWEGKFDEVSPIQRAGLSRKVLHMLEAFRLTLFMSLYRLSKKL